MSATPGFLGTIGHALGATVTSVSPYTTFTTSDINIIDYQRQLMNAQTLVLRGRPANPKPKAGSNLEWLDNRIGEIRVKL